MPSKSFLGRVTAIRAIPIGAISALLIVAATIALGQGPPNPGSTDNVVHVDGNKYPFTSAGIQAAIKAACTGNVPGKVMLPAESITSISDRIRVSESNCTIEGRGKNASTLQASSTFPSGGILVVGGSHVNLLNFGVDGFRSSGNTKEVDCIDIGSNSTNTRVEGVRAHDCLNQGLVIAGGDGDIVVTKSEFDRNGSGNISSTATGGIAVSPGDANINAIQIGPGNLVHDNNQGIRVANPTSATKIVSGVHVIENEVFSNANDAIAFLGTTAGGGQISHFSATGNHVYCNGYMASGWAVRFPQCKAGLLQGGSINSGGGVGIDVIQNSDELTVYGLISGNRCSNNTFECVALSGNYNARANVSGTSVSWVSGPKFNTSWKTGQTVCLGPGVRTCLYKIASVQSDTSLTLQTRAKDGSSEIFNGPGSMYTTVTQNEVLNDGSENGGPVGPGFFCQFSDHNTYKGNVAKNNYMEGFNAFDCSFTSYDGDQAIGNGVSRVSGRTSGFASWGSMGNSYSNILSEDRGGSPTQEVGLQLDSNTSETKVVESQLSGSKSGYSDVGAHNAYQKPTHPR